MNHFPHDQDILYRKIVGGISFPGTKPGFIVIVGELKQPNDRKFILFDEYESFDVENLIIRAFALDLYYKPEKWVSGELDKATTKLLMENNRQISQPGARRLRIVPSRIVGLENEMFRYVYPKLKRMTGENGELDISKGKMILNYMSLPQDSEVGTVRFGDYPAIESLCFCAMELEEYKKHGGTAGKAIHDSIKI